MSPVLSDVLQSTSRIHVDATFKVLPRQLQAKQLLTIHRIQNNKLFTCAYVIMTRKPIAGYSLVFEFVRNVLRGLNPSIIMTDYEESLRRSLRTAFPNATLIGCWFHFDQNVFKCHRNQQLLDLLSEGFSRFFRYIKNFWLTKVTPAELSVFGQPMRTNTSIELFHHRLNSCSGGHHPSVLPCSNEPLQIM